ncbi:hypothetical protein lerEdw1_007463 [Lerista edwardsae]|nr:hypothetical protein lerEdw1_007463 [Lerista edwardsae]
MLDPSSSEEESDEVVVEEERRDVLVVAGGAQRARPPHREPGRQGSAGAGMAARPASPSPSPSVRSEGKEEQERLQKEESEKRLRLQLYVFVVRCIAYPFNAKQPTDMARRQQKNLEKISVYFVSVGYRHTEESKLFASLEGHAAVCVGILVVAATGLRCSP